MFVLSEHWQSLSQENMFYVVGSMDSIDFLSADSMLLGLLHCEAEGFGSNLILESSCQFSWV